MRRPTQQQAASVASWLLVLLASSTCNAATIRDEIVGNPNLSIFRTALSNLGILDLELDDPDLTFTVFAPTDAAMNDNQFMRLYMLGVDARGAPRWHLHLERSIRNHMIENSALTTDLIFDQGTHEHLFSMEDPLRIQRNSRTVMGAQFQSSDIQTDNGVLHVMDRVITPEFYEHSFENLELQSEFGPDWLDRPSMQTIVDFTGARSHYTHIIEEGQTQVGCRIRALNRIGLFYLPKTINRSEKNIIEAEFLNASFRDETVHNLIDYSLIHKNYYLQDLPRPYTEWIMASNGCSHILVTRSIAGTLCFNDGCVVSSPRPREFIANNGYGYVVDKCIVCSGVGMLLEYAAVYTTWQLQDASQFWETSEWNLRNISMSVGDGNKVTLLAALDPAFMVFNAEDVSRISTDKWKRHQWNFLEHNMLQGEWTENDFYQRWFDNQGRPYNLTALSGENVTFSYNEERKKVTCSGGDLVFTGLKGVDGLLHFMEALPLPKSVTHSVYDIALDWPDYSTQITYIDTVFLKHDLKRLIPITALFAHNDDWANKVIDVNDISKSVLENHVFAELWWCDTLRGMVGEFLDSHNGQQWKISVNETTNMPCFDTLVVFGGPVRRSCITECDIMVRNGIVHKIDKALFFEVPETVGPQPPAIPTAVNPAAPNFYTPPAPPAPGWKLERPTFYGPINPAYTARGEEGHNQRNAAGSTQLSRFLLYLTSALVAVWTLCG